MSICNHEEADTRIEFQIFWQVTCMILVFCTGGRFSNVLCFFLQKSSLRASFALSQPVKAWNAVREWDLSLPPFQDSYAPCQYRLFLLHGWIHSTEAFFHVVGAFYCRLRTSFFTWSLQQTFWLLLIGNNFMSTLCENLGRYKTRSLPAFNAFTGCDSTSSFFDKEVHMGSLEFISRGDWPSDCSQPIWSGWFWIPRSISLSSCSSLESVNEARKELFCKRNKTLENLPQLL